MDTLFQSRFCIFPGKTYRYFSLNSVQDFFMVAKSYITIHFGYDALQQFSFWGYIGSFYS